MRIPKWIASALTTGSAPGRPRQTGQVCVFGGSPKEVSQPQNIFVRVASWMWISRPITGSSSDTCGAPVEAERPLQGVRRVEQLVLAEGRPGQLQPHRQPLREA